MGGLRRVQDFKFGRSRSLTILRFQESRAQDYDSFGMNSSRLRLSKTSTVANFKVIDSSGGLQEGDLLNSRYCQILESCYPCISMSLLLEAQLEGLRLEGMVYSDLQVSRM